MALSVTETQLDQVAKDTRSLDSGYIMRPKYTYSSASAILIDACAIHLSGTSEQMLSLATQTTFTFGSGGSNSASDDLTASAFHYLYIDDSAVEAAGSSVLTASAFLNDTTAPTYNQAKGGWYNGNDRCIGAFRTDGSSQLSEFFHDGDFFCYGAHSASLTSTDIDTTWTDVILAIPGFCSRGELFLDSEYVDTGTQAFWRPNGSALTGHYFGIPEAGSTRNSSRCVVATDTSQTIEVRHNDAGGEKMQLYISGWYFPTGM